MSFLTTSACLLLFLLWCHRILLRGYKLDSSVDTTKQSIRVSNSMTLGYRLVLVVGLFCLAYMLVIGLDFLTVKYFAARSSVIRTQNNAAADEVQGVSERDGKDSFIELLPADKVNLRFADVAGLKEVKDEVNDIIYFLHNPTNFRRLGAKPPRGLIMHGLPGTGKTMLARAMAGEAGVAFIAVSGSQFDEEYVGVGASRVRKLFKLAKKNAPCIIFIDEIDSLAYKRDAQHAPWASQTVNQLLTEMDGLASLSEDIIIVGASNRLDALDKAILRPGRFDRQVKLELPTQQERYEILSVYLNKVTKDPALDLLSLARNTIGFSGAELANLVNEAAIFATKNNQEVINALSFEEAKDRLILGAKRQSMQMSAQEKKLTAYHEAGHALVGHLLPNNNNVLYKVTIAPRGPSLGHTSFEPKADKYSYNLEELNNNIAMLLGGRVAEELVFGKDKITTGAESDLAKANSLAYGMVAKWGYSDKIGLINADTNKDLINTEILQLEVKKVLERNYLAAKNILLQNRTKLDNIAEKLLEQETLTIDEFRAVLKG